MREINGTHLKRDIAGKVQWLGFFKKIYGWQGKTKRKRKHRKPNELSELKSVVILEAAEKSQ